MKDKVTVVKIGGATLGSHDTTIEDIVELQRRGIPVVIVHGGGKLITEWLARLGIPAEFVRGERVTDKRTLEVVVAVLAGMVNKDLVAAINSLGGRAMGISGVDGGLVRGEIADASLGFVGAVVAIDLAPLDSLLQAGYVPVVAPVSLNAAKVGQAALILNINADAVAGDLAAALGAERLIFLTDVDGIHDRAGKLLSRLSPGEAESLVASGVASGGMIPKIRASLRAVVGGPGASIIDGRQPHALLREIEGSRSGTVIAAGS